MTGYYTIPENIYSSSIQDQIKQYPQSYAVINDTAIKLANQLHMTPLQEAQLQTGSIASSYIESGLNPTQLQIGGGGGVGLFQLSPGGEGNNLTQAQKLNPFINAYTAMKNIASMIIKNPNNSIGTNVNLAQAPKYSYANKLNGDINMSELSKIVHNKIPPASTSSGTNVYVASTQEQSSNNNSPSSTSSGTKSSIPAGSTSWLSKIVVVVIGVGLLFIGLNRLGKGSSVEEDAKEEEKTEEEAGEIIE